MLPAPRASLSANSAEFESLPLVKPTGFREYDARWWFGAPGADKAPELNLLGVQALGLGLGTLIHEFGVAPRIVVGHDFRFYSMSIKQALTVGLAAAAWATRLLSGFLFGVAPSDVPTFLAVGVGLTVVALVACAIPARRAAKIDAITALRQ